MVAVAIGSAVAPRRLVRPSLIIGAACAVLPDIDAIGRPFHHAAGDLSFLGGHRGFTHSLTFAAILGLSVSAVTLADSRWAGHRLRLAAFVAAATALHGVLDMFARIGASTSPVQLLSPWSTRGFAVSWHPISGPFDELVWCVLPLTAMTLLTWRLRGIPWPRLPSRQPQRLDL
jgi:inner membrane protein